MYTKGKDFAKTDEEVKSFELTN